jgi:FeS assembly SUF system regulator
MLRIGKLTDYATVILATLAGERARLQNASSIAERTGVSAPTVSKLLKQLNRAGLVSSTRGTRGGYQLARSADDISAASILDALEGPLALTDCSVGTGHCCLEHSCTVGRTWQRLNVAIRKSLSEISLAQLAGLDACAPSIPIERELKQFTRAKAAPGS